MNNYRLLLLFLLLSIHGIAFSKPLTREEYIQKYYPLAISEMLRSGIPASITLAQGCWESQNGNSRLATEANNHFGIKCKEEWKGKTIHHDDDAKHECFRSYERAEASYIDHTDFLMTRDRYAFLFKLDPKDYVGWAKGLKKAGYATDPTYAERLIKIIEENKLYVYDDYGVKQPVASIKKEPASPAVLKSSSHNKIPGKHKVELRNGLHSIVVGEGDTYASLTKEFKMKDWQLATYNDLPKGAQPKMNEILYLDAKYKRASKAHQKHVIEKGENMHYVAQVYGIRLKQLLKRNRMKPGDEPAVGQVIYLHHKRPRRG
ncbi:MAG: glucosaminidase domain-containing protein [Candidatus Saccharibacteria bacterium]